jgi:hypothetical protein
MTDDFRDSSDDKGYTRDEFLNSVLTNDIRLQFLSTFELRDKTEEDLIYFYTANFLFYGFKIDPLKSTWDSEKYDKEVFSEYVGIMIFLSGEAFIGEFSGGFKPNGEGMMFFAVGATLRGYFHEGNVHNQALISLPFNLLIFTKFSKGVISSYVTRINLKTQTSKSMKYMQGKFKDADGDKPLDQNLESHIKDSFSKNLMPDHISSCNEPDVIYFGSFLETNESIFYGFVRGGLPFGWGVRVSISSPNDQKISQNQIFDLGIMSWQMAFFEIETPSHEPIAFGYEVLPKNETNYPSNVQIPQKNSKGNDFNPFVRHEPSQEAILKNDSGQVNDRNFSNNHKRDRDSISKESVRYSRPNKADPSLKPYIVNYKQNRIIYGMGRHLEFVGCIGLYTPLENCFEKGNAIGQVFYTTESPDLFEGIPRNFITDIFRIHLEQNKVLKKETFILPTVFDLTYFNEAFFFFLYGFLKSKSREVFPDNVGIIQSNFFRDPKTVTQSNHNSWTDSDMASFDHTVRLEQRKLASLEKGRQIPQKETNINPNFPSQKFFRSDNQDLKLGSLTPSNFKEEQTFAHRFDLTEINPIKEIDEQMMELSQNPFNKKNKVVHQQIEVIDSNSEKEIYKEGGPQIPDISPSFKDENFARSKSGSGIRKLKNEATLSLENSKVSKECEESPWIKNLKARQDLSFEFKPDFQPKDDSDCPSERNDKFSFNNAKANERALNSEKDNYIIDSGDQLKTKISVRTKKDIAKDFLFKMGLVFGKEQARRVCSENNFLNNILFKSK